MTPTFDLEKQHTGPIVGVDEAGCGPWAGPVIAAAAILDYGFDTSVLSHIRDSKQMTLQQRLLVWDAFQKWQGKTIWFSVGEASVFEIDQLNIREATKLAMKRAIDGINPDFSHILIDGNRAPELNKTYSLIIKGDQKSLSIAAASIIAKVTRDRIMNHLHEAHPQYHWHKNAGYGTNLHQQAIALGGITSYHRQSFRPIRDYIIKHNIDISANNDTIYKKIYAI